MENEIKNEFSKLFHFHERRKKKTSFSDLKRTKKTYFPNMKT